MKSPNLQVEEIDAFGSSDDWRQDLNLFEDVNSAAIRKQKTCKVVSIK